MIKTKKKTEEHLSKNAFYVLFLTQLSMMLNGEKQLVQALPAWIKQTTTPELKTGFTNHLEETRSQVARLNDIFKKLKESPSGEISKGMSGLIEECSEIVENPMTKLVKDAALIAAARRIEHYEMAVYGTLIAFGQQFELKEVVALLQDSLREEAAAEKFLKKLGQGSLFNSGIYQLAKEEII